MMTPAKSNRIADLVMVPNLQVEPKMSPRNQVKIKQLVY